VERDTYYTGLFYVSAIFNWVAALTLLFGDSFLRSLTDTEITFDPLSKQLFCGCVAVFGIGYWIVARDISRNRGLVWIGIIGKLMVISVLYAHAIAGSAPYSLASLSLVDLVFTGLFVEFLLNRAPAD